MNKSIVCLIVAASFTLLLNSQGIKDMQDSFLEAEYFFVNEDYSDALVYYLDLYEKMPENNNLAYRIGLCYLNIPGKKNLSVNFLEIASKDLSAKHKEGTISQKSAPYVALFELANAYRINYQFDKARETYMKYKETLLPDDKENIDFIEHQIKVCNSAKELIARPRNFTEENMGEIFNDDKPNFNPVISANGKAFAFMVSLKFYDAVMFSKMINSKWTAPVNIIPEIQSDGDLYISCLSADGKTLFLSKDDNFNSEIYSSTYNGTRWSPAVKLNRNINTRYWESHGFISEDGKMLIFASDRPGGFGGLDLYISHKEKGNWGAPVKIGPEINTPYNEDRPFLINNGKTLFFSSQGHDNMGGYDIFRSDLQPNGLWSKPENIGYPVNTPDDDLFFMPVENGTSGYISKFKESGGFGKEDIYRIIFK
jgi:hypothetical protein